MAKRKRRTSNLSMVRRLLWRYPWLSVVFVVALLGWYGYEVAVARPAMAWMGLPQATQLQPAYWTHVLRNEGFMVGYSELRANPLWVTYRLTSVKGATPRLKRPGRFDADWRSLARIGHDDYTGSGYTRGHLAPNHAIAQLYGYAGQRDTFLMTNITPQRAELNSQVWQRLEQWEAGMAQRYGTLWVVTGPLFDERVERLASSMQVEIPDAFYKIVAVPAAQGGTPLLRAFIVPQNVNGSEGIDRFGTSVDEVERRSGFDFFSELPDELELRLEVAGGPPAAQAAVTTRLRPARLAE